MKKESIKEKEEIYKNQKTQDIRSEEQEIIANLWYVMDEDGYIYSLRARLYIAEGREENKLKMLLGLAEKDYLIAKPFPVPKDLKTIVLEPEGEYTFPVIHINIVKDLGGPEILFEEAYDILESELPIQTELIIPEDPLVVITPLQSDDNGNIFPMIAGRRRI